ncbi:hypothetical protein EIN_064250 [Entamoeba invadens IP1]|uniref:small monomeric GTPase n=1 Tax=Entamoeba invadens IP1 TaxID=370355 RepID=A0A0A1TXH1_ENTIV|nr:hypothetical protein EIN_064250 [Entamoeba invadens IP1]ELP84210.1 hypothetical protein EIN_064250 [Entamoeba invadens IP1]|eukprot:XP_004183556.1 hypothetical protein EIN_064250 [Entamoeba invadens IP1]
MKKSDKRLTCAHMVTVANYFHDLSEFNKLVLVSKKFLDFYDRFYYNPIQVTTKTAYYFPNVETFHVYEYKNIKFGVKYLQNMIKDHFYTKIIVHFAVKSETIAKIKKAKGVGELVTFMKRPLDSVISIAVLGDSKVGKTSLCLSEFDMLKGDTSLLLTNVFEQSECQKKHLVSGKMYQWKITDCALSAEYTDLFSYYYHKVDYYFLLYAVDSRESFENIKRVWCKPELFGNGSKIVLIATKVDLFKSVSVEEKKKLVSFEEGRKLAKDIGAITFAVTSSITEGNIKKIFDYVCVTFGKSGVTFESSKKYFLDIW